MKKVIQFATIFLLFYLCGCTQKAIQEEIPNIDEYTIIFQSVDAMGSTLGLYDFCEGDVLYLNLKRNFSIPTFVNHHEKYLLGLVDGISYGSGYPGRISTNQNKMIACKGGYVNQGIESFSFDGDSEEVLLTTPNQVYIYDVGKCEIREVLFNLDNNCEGANCDGGLVGTSITPDRRFLLMGLQNWPTSISPGAFVLLKYDLGTKDLTKIGEGVSPSVSHDGKKLAYLGKDGLYLLDLISEKTEKVVDLPAPNTVFSPKFNWSSNDTQLLFHFEPKSSEDEGFQNLQIIVFDIEEKVKTVLPVTGLYPAWISK